MKIGSKTIGAGAPPYVIAELGVNHDGSVERALELVEGAAYAGVDAVKLQLFRAEMLMSKAARLAGYQAEAGESDPVAMLKRLELSAEQMTPIAERARARGLHAIVTVFSVPLVGEAEAMPGGWDAYKTASPDIVHKPLLDALAATGKPMIVSTGASTAMEVRRAAEWLKPAWSRMALLQCVSCYPTRDADAAIEAMGDLATIFDGPIGYSDHTRGVKAARQAVLMGACVLEKHLTMDRTLPGPDHAASLEPEQMARYVREARRGAELAASYPEYREKILQVTAQSAKLVLECERDVRAVSRQSIVAARDLRAGEPLTAADLVFKRPGAGLEPWRVGEVLSHGLKRAVAADMPIGAEDLS